MVSECNVQILPRPRPLCHCLLAVFRCPANSDRQNNEHIRENRTKNRTNNRQNRMLQKTPNILLFIRLELYRITRPNSFVFILQNNQTEMALLGQTVLPPEPFPFFENTRFLVLCSRGLSKWACCCPHDGQNL